MFFKIKKNLARGGPYRKYFFPLNFYLIYFHFLAFLTFSGLKFQFLVILGQKNDFSAIFLELFWLEMANNKAETIAFLFCLYVSALMHARPLARPSVCLSLIINIYIYIITTLLQRRVVSVHTAVEVVRYPYGNQALSVWYLCNNIYVYVIIKSR